MMKQTTFSAALTMATVAIYAQAKKSVWFANVLLVMQEQLSVKCFLEMVIAMMSQTMLSVILMVETVVIMNGRLRKITALNVPVILKRLVLL